MSDAISAEQAPAPSPDALIAAQLRKPHGEWAAEVGQAMNQSNALLIRQTYALLPTLPEAAQLLEIGFGNGAFFGELIRRVPAGRVFGLDYSAEMVAEASVRHAQALAHGRLVLHEGQLPGMPYADQSMDAIISINTLYFWDQPAACLADLRRVLKPQGSLLLGFATRERAQELPFVKYGFQLYSQAELGQLLQTQGFELVDSAYSAHNGPVDAYSVRARLGSSESLEA